MHWASELAPVSASGVSGNSVVVGGLVLMLIATSAESVRLGLARSNSDGANGDHGIVDNRRAFSAEVARRVTGTPGSVLQTVSLGETIVSPIELDDAVAVVDDLHDLDVDVARVRAAVGHRLADGCCFHRWCCWRT